MYFVDNGSNYDASLNIALETFGENRLVDEPILLFINGRCYYGSRKKPKTPLKK